MSNPIKIAYPTKNFTLEIPAEIVHQVGKRNWEPSGENKAVEFPEKIVLERYLAKYKIKFKVSKHDLSDAEAVAAAAQSYLAEVQNKVLWMACMDIVEEFERVARLNMDLPEDAEKFKVKYKTIIVKQGEAAPVQAAPAMDTPKEVKQKLSSSLLFDTVRTKPAQVIKAETILHEPKIAKEKAQKVEKPKVEAPKQAKPISQQAKPMPKQPEPAPAQEPTPILDLEPDDEDDFFLQAAQAWNKKTK